MAMETNDLERLERMARMEAQVEQMNAVVIRMEAKLDAWATNYVTREESKEMFRARDKEIQEIKDAQTNNKALYASWASVAVAVVAAVVAVLALVG